MQQTDDVILRVSEALRSVTDIDAIVLGGSYATGHHTAHSDIDIGVYYTTSQLDLNALNRVAQALDDAHRPNLVTPPGGWGPWVNAGAWLTIDGMQVDLILRETPRVAQVISACIAGEVHAHYQLGHPHAYINAMYMGELAESQLLWDATGVVTQLKSRAEPYPEKLQQALLDAFGFEARFSSNLAAKSAVRHDLYYTSAHIIRAISCLNQVIFAVNRRYCLNEKNAVLRIEGFETRPYQYRLRVERILAHASTQSTEACDELSQLVEDTFMLRG